MSQRRRLLRSKKIGAFFIVVGAFFVPIGSALVGIGWTNRQNAIMAMNGELIPFNVDMSKPFDILLSAGVTFQYSSKDLANGFNLNTIFPFNLNLVTDQFQIEFTHNKLSVSVIIRNSDNVTIAQIINNEWKTRNPDTLLFWDRKYNAYAFEIIGSDNIPTLQVIMVGPNEIQIGGLFYTQTGRIYIQALGENAVLWKNPTDQQLKAANISRIFYYPALADPSNLGKMVNPSYPSSNPLFEPTTIFALGIILAALGTIIGIVGYEKYKDAKEQLTQIARGNRKMMKQTTRNGALRNNVQKQE